MKQLVRSNFLFGTNQNESQSEPTQNFELVQRRRAIKIVWECLRTEIKFAFFAIEKATSSFHFNHQGRIQGAVEILRRNSEIAKYR